MDINVAQFHQYNVTDTCSVWNILSSRVLYSAACSAKCFFILTRYVLYECLHKPRTNPTEKEIKLQERLMAERDRGNFETYSIDVADLQDVEILENRMRLSKGELVSIAFAKKTQQAFLTDDQKARKLATSVMESSMVQTTPHLIGWLFFSSHLTDGDKATILREHTDFSRPLSEYFEAAYQEALRCRLLAQGTYTPNHDGRRMG